MKITLGMPIHNCLNYSKLTMESFWLDWFKHNYKPEEMFVDFVIIDNASTDESSKYFQELTKWNIADNIDYHYIQFDKNYGCSKSFNQIFRVFKETNSDFCILINSDIVFSENWLEGLLDFYNKNPETGIVSSHVIDNHINYETITKWFGDPKLNTQNVNNIQEWYDYSNRVKETEKDVVDIGSHGCLTLLTRDCINIVGNYDENYDRGYYEDTDWNYRVLKAGFKISVTHNSTIFHWGGATSSYISTYEKTDNFREKNKQYFQRKWNVNLDAIGAVCSRSLFWTHPSEGVNELVCL